MNFLSEYQIIDFWIQVLFSGWFNVFPVMSFLIYVTDPWHWLQLQWVAVNLVIWISVFFPFWVSWNKATCILCLSRKCSISVFFLEKPPRLNWRIFKLENFWSCPDLGFWFFSPTFLLLCFPVAEGGSVRGIGPGAVPARGFTGPTP